MHIVQRIIGLLKERNVTPSKMCKDLKFSSGLFTQWKQGKQSPSAEKLQKIADYFEVSVDYLLGNTNIKNPSLNEGLNNIDFALAGELRDLTDAEKQDILDYIRFKKQSQKEGE